MKANKILVFLSMFLFIFSISPIHANAVTTSTHPIILLDEMICDDKDDNDCGLSTSDFITGALRSLDKITANNEAKQNYIKNFYNSAVTAKTDGIDFFKPSTIIMCIINVITMLFEMIGVAITFFVMLIYNFVSSSFMSEMVKSIFDGIDAIVFDWEDPNSWINKILVIAMILGLLYQLIKQFTKLSNWKKIMELVLSAFLTLSFIVFIGQNGRKIISGVETTVQSLVTQTFVFNDEANPEIANKSNMFDILQIQPFMLRHYGTTSYETIAKSSGQTVKQTKERVQNLLNDPSESNAEVENEDYNNKVITHDVGSAAQVLFLSVISLFHRLAISFVIGTLILVDGAVKLAKELMLALSVYQLIYWLVKRDRKSREWFLDRISWCIVAIVIDIIFSTCLYFVLEACRRLADIHPLFMLGFDAILITLIVFAIKHAGTIWTKIKDAGGTVFQATITGNESPVSTFNKIKNGTPDETDSSDSNTSNNIEKSENDLPFEDFSDQSNDDLSENGDTKEFEVNNENNESDLSDENETYHDETDTIKEETMNDANDTTKEETTNDGIDKQEDFNSEEPKETTEGSDMEIHNLDDETLDEDDKAIFAETSNQDEVSLENEEDMTLTEDDLSEKITDEEPVSTNKTKIAQVKILA